MFGKTASIAAATVQFPFRQLSFFYV